MGILFGGFGILFEARRLPKPYRVSPILRDGKTFYVAMFRNARGERLCRGLGTDNYNKAQTSCGVLADLWTQGIKSIADVPATITLDELTTRLYFGESANDDAVPTDIDVARQVDEDLKGLPPDIFRRMYPIAVDRARLRIETENQRAVIATYKRDFDVEKQHRMSLEKSILGRAAVAGARVPLIDKALIDYDLSLKTQVSEETRKQLFSVAKKFRATLPPERTTLIDITVEDVEKFIDAHVGNTDQTKQATSRDAIRRRIGRLINWGAERWEYPSQMQRVRTVDKQDIERERGDIHWHSLDEVKAALAAMPDDYWRCLAGTLVYAGLQLSELVWLRPQDVTMRTGRASLWVTTVEDPEDPGAKHLLKTGNRRREVNLHPKLLLSMIKRQLKVATGACLFPMPSTHYSKDDDGKWKTKKMRRWKRRKTRGVTERWIVSTLGTMLRGDPGGKSKAAVPGFLPDGMSAKSLRRTFGSLLLRSGKTTAEVATAMGNTEAVVKMHYARLLGCEVDVDF